MNKAILKNILMEFKGSITRTLSILIMVALGAMAIVGLAITGPSMRLTIDQKMEKEKMPDIRVTSTYNLDLEDGFAIEKAQGIEDIEYAHQLDVSFGEKDTLLRLEELSKYPNYQVIEGRLPKESGEIAIDQDLIDTDVEIGQTLSFRLANSDPIEDQLWTKDFIVVGRVRSPEYMTRSQKGRSLMGKGDLDGFGLILKEDFNLKDYGVARIFVSGARDLGVSSPEYEELVSKTALEIEKNLKGRPEKKLKGIEADAKEDISKGEADLADAKDQLSQAEIDLEKARADLDQGYEDYYKGKDEYEVEIAKAKTDLDQARADLDSGKAQLDQGWIDYDKGLNTFRTEISAGERKLESSRKELDNSRNTLEVNQRKYDEGKATFDKETKEPREELAKAKNLLDKSKTELENAQAQYEQGLADFESEIKKAKEEIAANEKLMAQTKEELDQSEIKISQGEKELPAGWESYRVAKEELDSKLPDLEASLANLQGQQAELDSAKAQVQAGISALDSALGQAQASKDQIQGQITSLEGQLANPELTEAEKADIQSQISNLQSQVPGLDSQIQASLAEKSQLQAQLEGLNSSQSQLDGGWAQYKEGRAAYDAGAAVLSETKSKLEATEAELVAGKETLRAGRTEYEKGLAKLEEAKQTLPLKEEEGKKKLEASKAQLDQGQKEYDAGLAEYEKSYQLFVQKTKPEEDKLRAAKTKLDQGWQAYYYGESQYKEGLETLAAERLSGQKELDQALATLEKSQRDYDIGLADYQDGQATYEREKAQGEKDLQEAYNKLLDGEKEYQDGLAEYEDEKSQAQVDIDKGEKDIADAKETLTKLVLPSYKSTGAYKDYAVYMYTDSSKSMDRLSFIFPGFFFAIAMLVTLTTMSRMVDEERTEIGTMEALGYSSFQTGNKYRIYGLIPSIIGAFLGVALGYTLISPMIFRAYTSGFLLREQLLTSYPGIILVAVVTSIGLVMAVIEYTLRKTNRENPAQLMRPKPPKEGSRIFLERLTFLWRRMSFFQKVTARNIFRYKARMLMTLIGVAGCTALMFMGFGIKDSIVAISPNQYKNIIHYDLALVYNPDSKDLEQLDKTFAEQTGARTLPVVFQSGDVKIESKNDQTLSIITLTDENYPDFVSLRERASGKELNLEDGVVISEKLATMMNLKTGDNLVIEDEDGIERSFPIGGVTENYISHYIYLSPKFHKEIYREEAKNNAYLIDFEDGTEVGAISSMLMKEKATMAVIDHNKSNYSINELLNSLNIVVLVLISISMVLAVVVLYNLTNINISERIRELSTIKVLGFYPGEVTSYVYRETLVLSVIGIFIGFGLGRILHLSIITTMAPDVIMMVPRVKWTNFFLSAAITIAISLAVMVIMHIKLMRVDMVEAMKAIE